MHKGKKTFLASLLTLALLMAGIPANAQETQNTPNTQAQGSSDQATLSEFAKINAFIEEDANFDKQILLYMEKAVGKDDLVEALNKYQDAFPEAKDQVYEMLEESLRGTWQQVNAYHFSEEQARILFSSRVDLETNNATVNEMTSLPEIPDYAPQHRMGGILEDDLPFDLNPIYFSAGDRSTRTNYDTTGVGYEVQSKVYPGYNQTTAYVRVGDCNVSTDKKGGYMFYTFYHNNKSEDIGIGYFENRWHVAVYGDWDTWLQAPINISAGDKLYFHLWIGKDRRVHFKIYNGNTFAPIFENSYSTNNELPQSGAGVGWNRQITLVDNSHYLKSGLYLKNASFDQGYLYNAYTTEKFNNNNTVPTRRGKFGCSWAPDSTVTILDNSHWSSEKVTIQMPR